MAKAKKIGAGIGLLALVGLGIWALSRRGAIGAPTAAEAAMLQAIKAESLRLGSPLTINEANAIVFTEEELRTGIATEGVSERIIIPAIKAGTISMTDAEIRFWLQDVTQPGVWEALEAEVAEISQQLGMDIGAGEMREAARQVRIAIEKASPEVASAAARAGMTVEEYIAAPDIWWRTEYQMEKVSQAAELGIPTEGRTRQDILNDLSMVEAGLTTVAVTVAKRQAEVDAELAAYAQKLRDKGATEESIQRDIEQNQNLGYLPSYPGEEPLTREEREAEKAAELAAFKAAQDAAIKALNEAIAAYEAGTGTYDAWLEASAALQALEKEFYGQ